MEDVDSVVVVILMAHEINGRIVTMKTYDHVVEASLLHYRVAEFEAVNS
jgi:hypothetical protein